MSWYSQFGDAHSWDSLLRPLEAFPASSTITQTQASATTLTSWVPWPSHQDKISHSHGSETVLNNSLHVNHWFQTFPGLETFFFKEILCGSQNNEGMDFPRD